MKPDLDDTAHGVGLAAKSIARRAIVDLAKFHRSYDNPVTMDLLEMARDALRIAVSPKDGTLSSLADARQRVAEMESKLKAYGVE